MTEKTDACGRRAAEEIAIAALTFLVTDPERLDRFLAMTGIDPATIREAARAPRFLAGVLDHVTGEEALLLAFCADAGIGPDAVTHASETLAGRRWEREYP